MAKHKIHHFKIANIWWCTCGRKYKTHKGALRHVKKANKLTVEQKISRAINIIINEFK